MVEGAKQRVAAAREMVTVEPTCCACSAGLLAMDSRGEMLATIGAHMHRQQRPVLLSFFLDDSAASKNFAPLLSDLQGRWGKVVEVIALPSDPYSVDPKAEAGDPSRYWRGTVPQLLVINSQGEVLYDVDGLMDPAAIETALSQATGLELSGAMGSSTSFNEINSGYGS